MTKPRTPAELDGRSPRHAFDPTQAHIDKCRKCYEQSTRPERPQVVALKNETPMPANTLGQLVTEDGEHYGWIVASPRPLTASVHDGMMLIGHDRKDLLRQFEGKRIVILEVKA